MTQPARITAPAKVNLCLHITGRRPDGFHLLESLAVFTQFGDELELRPASRISLEVTGPYAGALHVESREQNLVWRAAHMLQAATGVTDGAAITLHKNIPIGAGLGGGSADAAAVLIGLMQLWQAPLPTVQLHAIALQLGSDVPACLVSKPVWMAGVGEHIKSVSLPRGGWLVLVNPGVSLLTSDVYRGYAPPFSPPPDMLPPLRDTQALATWASRQHNALEAPAIRKLPLIRKVIHAIGQTEGCLLARMSGSGATCFGVYATEAKAKAAAALLAAAHPQWWVQPTALQE
ncbi:MAG: 4-(cytidine 5'-diphospho)-2-C-methyl-D-erythritol kinase [Alphaproteobacteria bacterium]|nr:4-(cytidine 5'-diphospho)-2-C-methyl-D-erythritol kinase [Alphaproteobacteria bacterium]